MKNPVWDQNIQVVGKVKINLTPSPICVNVKPNLLSVASSGLVCAPSGLSHLRLLLRLQFVTRH